MIRHSCSQVVRGSKASTRACSDSACWGEQRLVRGHVTGVPCVRSSHPQLSDGRQQPGSVRPQLTVLLTESELDGEEVTLVRDTDRGQTQVRQYCSTTAVLLLLVLVLVLLLLTPRPTAITSLTTATTTAVVPPHRRQPLDVLVRRSQRRQSDLLGELGELGVGEERHVAQQLVTRVAATQEQVSAADTKRVT